MDLPVIVALSQILGNFILHKKTSVLVDIKTWLGMIHISVPNLAILFYVFDKEYNN